MRTGELQAGIAEREIQPETGLMLGDGAPVARGARTPLYSKALVLSNGTVELAVVTLDLMGISLEDTNRVRELVCQRCGMDRDNIMLCCSHTHVAPSVLPSMHTYRKTFNPLCDEAAIERERRFVDRLVTEIADNVCEAAGNLKKASVGCIKKDLPWLTFNRRRYTRNYGVHTHWMGIPKDQAYGVEGPIDPSLELFVVRGADYNPIAMLWNFAGHNSFFFDDNYSADISHTVQKALDERIGAHIPCLYTAGCGGNLNYYDFQTHREDYSNVGLDKATGEIASAIMASYRDICSLPEIELAAQRAELVFAQRDISRQWWRDDVEKKLPEWNKVDYLEKEAKQRRREGKAVYTSEIMAFRIGNAALVSLPGEVFVEFGLDIKERSPFRYTTVAAYSNDYSGYVATRRAFINGSYEAWPAMNAKIGKEGGYLMADKAVELLNKLYEEE